MGTGIKGEPRRPIDTVIERINAAQAPVLAVDLPSGLDCDSGKPAQCTIRAEVTCTFVAAKPGLLVPEAKPYTGHVDVLDIGVPRRVIEEVLAEG